MRYMISVLIAINTLVLAGCTSAGSRVQSTSPATVASSEKLQQPDFDKIFKGHEGTFVLLDAQTGRTIRHNPARAGTRYLPASTFKIPNTVIALDSGVADGPDFSLPWDSTAVPRQPWWPAAWARNHTLSSALPNSVVWFYKELARRTGAGRMQKYADQFGYGNRDIGGGIDQFWLTGGLRISADEQVDFLQRFHAGRLGVSDRAIRLTKDMLVLETTAHYRLSGKSGWAGFGAATGPLAKPQLGWLVGYLEQGNNVYFFAMNLDIRNTADAAERMRITKDVFHASGLMLK